MTPPPKTRPPRIEIQDVWPSLDCGRWPAKRTLGETLAVSATIFADGHDVLRAAVRYRGRGARRWQEAPMEHLGNDRWLGSFEANVLGRWEYSVAAWVDRWASWRHELDRKVEVGQASFESELAEGAALLGVASLTLDDALEAEPELPPEAEISLPAPLELIVDRERARVGAWYELFPRSFGGLAGVERVVPRLAELGFDVLYFPPIHPIGTTHRKGRNNTLEAGPGDPGSPWAIGSPEGGHEAIARELGTFADLERLVAGAAEHGLEIALDFAIQCSPDHPWLKEHPEWFQHRPDGTLKYAENPPKRYQDIYNLDFASEDWRGLWQALLDLVLGWASHGIRIFRVDNPHTKPIAFWSWLIREAQAAYPDLVFLSEAFTRPAHDGDAREGRLQPVLHVLHVAERGLGVDRLREGARGRRPDPVLPAELLRRTRRTSSRRTSRRAGGRRSKRGSSSQRRSRRATASTPASRTSSASRSAPVARSTSTRRSTSSSSGRSTGRSCPSSRS